MQESTEVENKIEGEETKLTRRIGWICSKCNCVTLEKERLRPKTCGSPDCDSVDFSTMVFVFGGPKNSWRKPKK
jgi:hypothetical protein